MDPDTREFVYVPIPEGAAAGSRLATPYSDIVPAVDRFLVGRDADQRAVFPKHLHGHMHLDPDFGYLTYGDDGTRRGKRIAAFERGDLIVFYAGLRPCRPTTDKLVYALIGIYRVQEVLRVESMPKALWYANAHTRRSKPTGTDIVIRAIASVSGRLRKCIPIGEWRDGAYRVRRDILDAWGNISCRDGYIQRSAVPPLFLNPSRFASWWEGQATELVAANNP